MKSNEIADTTLSEIDLAVQWRKENAKYVEPADLWVWLEFAFIAGYTAGKKSTEGNTP